MDISRVGSDKHWSCCIFFLFIVISVMDMALAEESFDGFQNARWGMNPSEVQKACAIGSWSQQMADPSFPAQANITVYSSNQDVAGYPASIQYYFWNNKFFQATIRFNFDYLKTYDFNYNVFRSVDQYYRVIHDQTITFVNDIYELLRKKYGKKKPVFKGLDPRFTFKRTNAFLKQERWNLRYSPYEYYKNIVASSYARWDYPKTKAIFSINISAADKRFDYLLSLSSVALEDSVKATTDSLRMQQL